MIGRLLVIDDDESTCRSIHATFAAEQVDVIVEHDGAAGVTRALAADQPPDVVLVDVQLPGVGGLTVLDRIKAANPILPVIMVAASRDVKTAIRAMQAGAAQYLTTPLDRDELLLAVRRAIESRALTLEVAELRRRVACDTSESLASAMGTSAAAGKVVDQVAVVAATDTAVLIVGEPGTGKALVAQAIHRQSGRRLNTFIAVNCGAIPEAVLESELFGHEPSDVTAAEPRTADRVRLADGGTCLLEDIGSLPPTLQGRLLRVLESRQASSAGQAAHPDVRFVAATSEDLQARVARGSFRADLYFRLAQSTIAVPPLRDRREDIEFLARKCLRETSIELRRPIQAITPSALAHLEAQRWPGNVRELRAVIRQAVLRTPGLVVPEDVLKSVIEGRGAAAIPGIPPSDLSLRETAEQAARAAERQAIVRALQATMGNKSRAARALKTDYKTLHVKMKSLKIRAHDFKVG